MSNDKEKWWHSPACSSHPWSWWSVSSSAPWLLSFPVSLTPRQYQKNNTLSSSTLLAHCAKVFLLIYALSLFSVHSLRSDKTRPQSAGRPIEKQGERDRERQKVNLTRNNVSSGTSKHRRALRSVLEHIQKAWEPHGMSVSPQLLHLSHSWSQWKMASFVKGQQLHKSHSQVVAYWTEHITYANPNYWNTLPTEPNLNLIILEATLDAYICIKMPRDVN